jgi:predicted permease
MFGNTGYIGFPIVLLLPQLGLAAFGWALFYDLLGTLFGAYGWGVAIAAHHSQGKAENSSTTVWLAGIMAVLKTPTIWSFFLGLGLKAITLPAVIADLLRIGAWLMVILSLILMGMRLHQLRSWAMLKPALHTTCIRMLVTPFLLGWGLTLGGILGAPRLALVLQAGMPSAFATLVLTEAFELNRDLAVTCVGISSIALMLTLPIWLLCFPV